jgi:hypothetical protein
MRAISVLVLALACTSSPGPPKVIRSPRLDRLCGLPQPTLGEHVLIIVLPTLVMGGVVAAGYAAIGGENPFR